MAVSKPAGPAPTIAAAWCEADARMIGDVAHQKIEIRAGALVDGLYKHLKPEDFEKRGERFKDVTPPELPKKVVPQSGKSDDAQSKPAAKQEEPAKALN